MINATLMSQAPTLNYEGGLAFTRSLRERVLQTLLVGVFGNTFYADRKSLDDQSLKVLLEARNDDPEFLAKAIVYARNKGFIKDVNTKGLAVLAGGRGKTRPAFEAIFDQVINIPDDLRVFANMCVSGEIAGKNGLGGYAAKAVAGWLSSISEYHALKYGSAASKGMTLCDVIKMSHPKPASPAVAERLGWLVRGKKALGSDPTLNPQIRAFEALKSAATEEEAITLIRQGRLPYEVVVPTVKAMTPAIWGELLRQAPYMNLLRNISTFTRHGVFQSEENVRFAVEKLTNEQAIQRSKVLPFRFFDAWRKYAGVQDDFDFGWFAPRDQRPEVTPDSRITDALREAANRAFINMPKFGKQRVAIGSDVSGSMSGTFGRGSTRYIDICGIFTGALLRQIEDRAIPLPFEHRVIPNLNLSGRDDILVTTEKLAKVGGGGTAVGAPVEYLLNRKIEVDVFVGITDGEDWTYGRGYGCSGSFIDHWRRYRSEINPEAKAFLVRIDPYDHANAPADEPGVYFISGWSDSVVRYIPLMLEGGASQVREVSRMSLATPAETVKTVTALDHAQTEDDQS
jgi:60 kDa SS-A/Ro ribonucleoprotein